VSTCPACRAEWEAFQRAIQLARELPAPAPTSQRAEQVRTAVLASMPALNQPAPKSRSRRSWLAATAAAAFLALVVMRDLPSSHSVARTHGTVHASADAVVDVVSMAPDEIVRLHSGRIAVEVDPLGAGERFRVIVGDAEIEVRGTAFEVVATHDHLEGVRVMRGRVDVRPNDRPTVTLEPGQSWAAEVAVAASSLPVQMTVVPAPAVSASPTPPPKPHERLRGSAVLGAKPPLEPTRSSASDLAYDDGWAAMRRSDFRAAVLAFARVERTSNLADDAAYWQAVALARDGRADEAIGHFRALLDEPSRSAHNGEASAMLGWLLVDAHQPDEARRRFDVAATDADPTVSASARAGLDALAQRRK
jgi:TolA-binding protein